MDRAAGEEDFLDYTPSAEKSTPAGESLDPGARRWAHNAGMNWTDLMVEHEHLKRQVEALQREHDALERKPYNRDEHHAHKVRLRLKIAELRGHTARLKRSAP